MYAILLNTYMKYLDLTSSNATRGCVHFYLYTDTTVDTISLLSNNK